MSAANFSAESPLAAGSLSIKLLGKAVIVADGAKLPALSARALPLLAMLVLADGPVTREAIARLLWRRVDSASALASLRQLLHHLAPALRSAISSTRNELMIGKAALHDCDVWSVTDALARSTAAEKLLSLYHGALLAGLVFDELPEFDDWLSNQRESLAARVRQVILGEVAARRRQCASGSAKEEIAAALGIAEAWLQRDPADETMHAEVMQLHLLAGNIRAAEAQFEQLRRTLATGAGRKPAPSTRAILEGALRRQGSIRGAGLPALATSFVGRQDELAEMARMASDPHCRLITLHGPGGMGKTRLALAFAEETRRHDDDAHFAALEAVRSAQALYAAIAAAFGLELSPRANPKEVLCEALRSYEGILILDNFEQLLPHTNNELCEARDFLPALLRAAPRMKMVVTSRVALGLQEEWVLELNGLSYQTSGTSESVDTSNETAIELFTSRARQAYRGFSRSAELPHVLAICRAAEGLPLALELAAAQVGSRPCAEIAQSLLKESGAATRASNRPERHASVRRVMEQSLAAASAEQARAFISLALFQGEFSTTLAFSIARVRESTLQELSARALIQRVGDQYKLHPLLRELAVARLARSRAIAARLEASYVAEISKRAATENTRLLGAQSQDAMATIPERFTDELHALKLACKIGDTERVVSLAAALVNTAMARGLVRACVEAWPEVNDALPVYAACALRIRRADLVRQLGEYDQALEEYRKAEVALACGVAGPPTESGGRALAFAIHAGRAGAFLFRGNYAEILVEHAAAEALADADVAFAERVRMDSFAGTALMELGELDKAETLLAARLAEADKAGASATVLVMLLNALGGVAEYQGKLDRCIEIHRHALSLLQDAGLQYMQSRHLCNLGGALLQTAGPKAAELVFEQAVTIATTYGDRGPLTFSQIGLAHAALMQNDYARAATIANQARLNARRMGSTALIAESGALMIRVAIERADFKLAAELLIELVNETESKVQGFRKLEIVFCGLKIIHATTAEDGGPSLGAAANLLLAHPACTDTMAKDIQAWVKSLNLPATKPGAKSRALAVEKIDVELEKLLGRVIEGVRAGLVRMSTIASR